MIVPNKVIRFNESIIGKVIYILEELSNGDSSIENLYTNTQEYFEGIDEFIFSLDVLYILDSIQVDFEEGVVKYVSRD
ncbi:ABC-three component system middle component 7 [Bacillus nitratireducens]|uniref:ABC-three component system middle component 7 n=1 Tax=Bacillus nitratireducens TaxID=2026193 RepID=UPI003D213680